MEPELENDWSGFLTTDNAGLIRDHLYRLLSSKFAIITTSDDTGIEPKVKLHEYLDAGITTRNNASGVQIRIDCSDRAYYICRRNSDDGEKAPWFAFQWDRVEIIHYAEGGNKLYWVFVKE